MAFADPHRHDHLADRFCAVRALTERLSEPLSPEDQTVQSMPDVSPTAWHRAHTTWFFETFVLAAFDDAYVPVDESYDYLFNSYYEAVGERQPRARRGMISRPGATAVGAYRAAVDRRVLDFLSDPHPLEADGVVVLGLHHEQQHQELLLMDIKHVLAQNPTHPSYRAVEPEPVGTSPPLGWTDHDGGLVAIGHSGEGFAFDNETPCHEALVRPFSLADRPVTCADWLEFMADGAYQRPELWLSDGWYAAQGVGWEAPLYWDRVDDRWWLQTLTGHRLVDPAEPVVHVSLYEADAFARWAGARLPTEFEWEVASRSAVTDTDTFDLERLHPRPPPPARPGEVVQMFGGVWEWTASPYSPYPGFTTPPGALGEYNGKFMIDQTVLRGGACVTPPGHVRATYRNFFPASARWPFCGLRLATDA